MKPYGLNGFTHEPIGPQTSNDLGPINEPKSAQISHYWPHPLKPIKFQLHHHDMIPIIGG